MLPLLESNRISFCFNHWLRYEQSRDILIWKISNSFYSALLFLFFMSFGSLSFIFIFSPSPFFVPSIYGHYMFFTKLAVSPDIFELNLKKKRKERGFFLFDGIF